MRTVKFYTLGCKANQYDTQVIREQFLKAGFKELTHNLPADVYLINTCTVTQRADSESLNLIRKSIRENPQARIIATGCFAELDKAKIKKLRQDILIFKNKEKNSILRHLCESTSQRVNEPTQASISYFQGHTRAFLKIQDGCNNFCSYCKVPLVRGRSRSKPLNLVISEAQGLVKNGFKEIVLTGICLGSYGKDLKPRTNLVKVIKALEKIVGLKRIRLSSIEANDITGALINKMAGSQKLCRHLHIPMQSGNNKILKMMHRKASSKYYLDLIKKIKKRVPAVAITTDIMVGFPGESEEAFQNTCRLIREVAPLKTHIFPYSLRTGTLAAGLPDKIDYAIVKSRVSSLYKVSRECSFKYRKKFLNKVVDLLVEGRPRNNPVFWEGHTDNYINVLIKSRRNLKNQIIPVRIKEITPDKTVGKIRSN